METAEPDRKAEDRTEEIRFRAECREQLEDLPGMDSLRAAPGDPQEPLAMSRGVRHFREPHFRSVTAEAVQAEWEEGSLRTQRTGQQQAVRRHRLRRRKKSEESLLWRLRKC